MKIRCIYTYKFKNKNEFIIKAHLRNWSNRLVRNKSNDTGEPARAHSPARQPEKTQE